jgi:hypothetical protein
MKRSLSIGINDYPGVGSDLSGCVNDAYDWKEALKKRGFDNQVILVDASATKKRIMDAIVAMVEETGPSDIGVITYSGHGTWVPDQDGDEADGRDEALCPHDIGVDGSVITDDELFEVFSQRKYSARIVFISDSCHSGTVARASVIVPGVQQDPWKFQRTRFLAPEFHLPPDRISVAKRVEKSAARSRIRAATVLFAGCQDFEYSYDAWFNGRPNGAFTFVALQALEQLEQNQPGPFDYQFWYKLIRQYLPHVYYPQTPQLHCARYQAKWEVFKE